MNYKIALKQPETRTTWDLMQVFFMATNLGYKAAAEAFCITREDVRDCIEQLEGITRRKLVKYLPKTSYDFTRYPGIMLTSEGAK